MLKTVLLLLPFMTCLFWLALNPLVYTHKDKAFKAVELLTAVFGTALLAQAGLALSDGGATLTFLLVKQSATLLVIPVSLAYIHSVMADDRSGAYLPAWITLPVSLLFAQFILITISGPDAFLEAVQNRASATTETTGRLARLCSFHIYYGALTVQTVIFLVTATVKRIKGGRNIQLCNTSAAVILYVLLEITTLWTGKWQWLTAAVSAILGCMLFLLSYSGAFLTKPVIRSVTDIDSVRKQPEPQAAERQPESLIADVHKDLADEEDLRIRFEDLISSEMLFLKQGTRLSDVASMLNTNRTYVSRLVNNTYNMSFSDYMNTLRIDYAEQYLLHHRDAKQSDIAAACGFPNASAFNNVFKKITGVTPKIWLANNS